MPYLLLAPHAVGQLTWDNSCACLPESLRCFRPWLKDCILAPLSARLRGSIRWVVKVSVMSLGCAVRRAASSALKFRRSKSQATLRSIGTNSTLPSSSNLSAERSSDKLYTLISPAWAMAHNAGV